MIGKSQLSGKKVFHTSLCIIPPKDIWPDIQDIRSKFDPAYERWMPHINMAFPFVSPGEFDTAAKLLQDELSTFPSFDVKFKEMRYFDHGKNSTLWLYPEVSNDELSKLQAIIQKCLPFCNDLTAKSEEGAFIPHLTVAKFDKKEISRKKDEFSKKWSSKEFKVVELSLIQRDSQTTPFYVSKTVRLAQQENNHHRISSLATHRYSSSLLRVESAKEYTKADKVIYM